MAMRERPPVMTLTKAAAARVRELMAGADNSARILKLGVKNGGCAGMAYTMQFADAPAKGDEIVEQQGVRLVIDPKAILFLLGTQMDFRNDKLSSGFVFNNPNQTSACGCGESVEITPADPALLAAD
jgi:iron-sulfur cluster assembly protein